MWIYLNDRFLPKEEAVVSVFDHGFLYGDGVYETLRSYGPTIFLLTEHLARLRRSADLIHLRIPIEDSAWFGILTEAMARNSVGTPDCDAYIRITISRGPGEIGLDPVLCPTPTLVIITKPLARPADTLYRNGIRLITAHTRRNQAESLNPQIKSLNFLNNILAKQEALAAGAYDAVMLNTQGEVAECTISNIFFVIQGRLCTPAIECGLLDGLTRNMVLTLARRAGIPTEEGRFRAPALQEASECFVTNTSSEVLPAVSLDGKPFGSGHPGPITQELGRLFREHVHSLLRSAT
ncbi:branched chain amino acid aminotransferase [Nitrospira sp.]|nr:branched chain amino acid aminotransferase [Nitrospira sp.]